MFVGTTSCQSNQAFAWSIRDDVEVGHFDVENFLSTDLRVVPSLRWSIADFISAALTLISSGLKSSKGTGITVSMLSIWMDTKDFVGVANAVACLQAFNTEAENGGCRTLGADNVLKQLKVVTMELCFIEVSKTYCRR